MFGHLDENRTLWLFLARFKCCETVDGRHPPRIFYVKSSDGLLWR